jgi:adenosyl cobinamide kinase/adenosyl cobinamide phosphate guanylyltransferase
VISLVVGGTRSGKSEVAEQLAARFGEPVTVIVPALATDADFAARIAGHRDRRPASWETVECGSKLVAAVGNATGTLLVDSLGTWVAGAPDFVVDGAGLVTALCTRTAPTVVVTEEVGLAVHPPTEVGRRFTDALGALNVAVAAVADDAVLVVAGRVLRLQSPGSVLEGN